MVFPRRARRWTTLLLTTAATVGGAVPACRSAGGSRAPADQTAEIERATREAIQNERAIDPASFPATTLGVTPLRVSATDTLIEPLGYGLADLLLVDLARSAQLQVVDRLRVDVLLREASLGQSGAVDPATAPRVGRLLGARRLIVGGLTQVPSGGLRLDARVVDVQTSAVDASIGASAPLDRILDAEKALAFQLFDRLGVTLTPAERAAVEQRPTRDIGALLAYGRAVRFEAQGNYAAAAGAYEDAAARDPGFGAAQARASLLRARFPGTAGGRSTRLRAASLRAAGEVNRSLAGQFGTTPADPAFRQAQSSTVVIIVRTVP